MSNYRQIPALLTARKDFKGSSMSAKKSAEGDYVVMSYTSIIVIVRPDGTKTWNEGIRQSQTTKRHINLCRAWL